MREVGMVEGKSQCWIVISVETAEVLLGSEVPQMRADLAGDVVLER